jgi:hypothetical protein
MTYSNYNYQYRGNKTMSVSNTFAHLTNKKNYPNWMGSCQDLVFVAGEALSLDESILFRNRLQSRSIIILNFNENQGQYVHDSLTTQVAGVLGRNSNDTLNDPIWDNDGLGLTFSSTSILVINSLEKDISNEPWLISMWIKIISVPPVESPGIICKWLNENTTYIQIYLQNNTASVQLKLNNLITFDLGITLDLNQWRMMAITGNSEINETGYHGYAQLIDFDHNIFAQCGNDLRISNFIDPKIFEPMKAI